MISPKSHNVAKSIVVCMAEQGLSHGQIILVIKLSNEPFPAGGLVTASTRCHGHVQINATECDGDDSALFILWQNEWEWKWEQVTSYELHHKSHHKS